MNPKPPKSYRPKSNSLANRVLMFFRNNPEEVLSTQDIALKFDVSEANIPAQLKLAVDAGFFTRHRERGQLWIYGLGLTPAEADGQNEPSDAAPGVDLSRVLAQQSQMLIDINEQMNEIIRLIKLTNAVRSEPLRAMLP